VLSSNFIWHRVVRNAYKINESFELLEVTNKKVYFDRKHIKEGCERVPVSKALSGHKSSVLCFDVKGDHLVSGSSDWTVRLWDLNAGVFNNKLSSKLLLKSHAQKVTCVSWMGDKIVSGSYDKTMNVFDSNTGVSLQSLTHHTAYVTNLVANENEIISCGWDRSVMVWDQRSNSVVAKFEHSYYVNHVTADDSLIVSSSDDGTVGVWSRKTLSTVNILTGHADAVSRSVLHGGMVISGSEDCSAKVWDAYTGECLHSLNGHQDAISALSYCDETRMVATGSASLEKFVKVWDVDTGECLNTLYGNGERVSCVQINKDCSVITGCADKSVRVWDAYLGQCMTTLQPGHKDSVTKILHIKDNNENRFGGKIISSSNDGNLKMWIL